MKDTVRERIMFGKSDIHGWGVFARQTLRAGDMVIEYIGHTMRGTVADVRERNYYDKIVGAGTYIFRINDNLVIDATKVIRIEGGKIALCSFSFFFIK